MNTWTDDELNKINGADELHIATMKEDGTLRNPVTIWVIRIDENLYIRAVKGPNGLWYRHATENHKGHIDAGGVSKDVMFIEAGENITDAIDQAYRSKYNKYADNIVNSTLTQQAQSATLQIIPL